MYFFAVLIHSTAKAAIYGVELLFVLPSFSLPFTQKKNANPPFIHFTFKSRRSHYNLCQTSVLPSLMMWRKAFNQFSGNRLRWKFRSSSFTSRLMFCKRNLTFHSFTQHQQWWHFRLPFFLFAPQPATACNWIFPWRERLMKFTPERMRICRWKGVLSCHLSCTGCGADSKNHPKSKCESDEQREEDERKQKTSLELIEN